MPWPEARMFGSPLKPAGQAQGPTHRKNPQGIYASRKADDRSYRSNRTGLNGDTPARLLEAVPGARHEKRENTGRPAHRRRRHGRAGKASDMISDQRHDDDVGPRRDLRNRETVGELPITHPMHHLDSDTMHFWNRGVRATNRKQRQQRKIACQCNQRVVIHLVIHAHATLIGASTAKTSGSGHCMMATPTNAAIAMRGAQSHRFLNNGVAILATTAINRPVAAAVMPVRIRPSASTSP